MKTYLKKFKYQIKNRFKTDQVSFFFPLSEVKTKNDLSREIDSSVDIVSESEDEFSEDTANKQKDN